MLRVLPRRGLLRHGLPALQRRGTLPERGPRQVEPEPAETRRDIHQEEGRIVEGCGGGVVIVVNVSSITAVHHAQRKYVSY